MGMMDKISGYFKQLAGEVTGNQVLHDEGRREAEGGYREQDEQVVPVAPRKVSAADTVVSAETGRTKIIHADAVPQFEVSQAGRTNDGISSAKPRVITGSDDATVHRTPPGMETAKRDWSVGFDENAPRQDLPTPVADYSDPDQLKLFRLVPIASATDTNWDIAPNQGEVVVVLAPAAMPVSWPRTPNSIIWKSTLCRVMAIPRPPRVHSATRSSTP